MPEGSVYQEWAQVRRQVIVHFFEEKVLPALRASLRNELFERAERHVLRHCAAALKSLLLTAPWSSNDAADSSSGESVMSVVMGGDQQIGVVFLNSHGEVQSTDVLHHFYKGYNENASFEQKKLFLNEKNLLDSKVARFQPSIIVVAANSISSRKIKREMLCYREEGSLKFTKWVTFGDDTIP